MHIGVFSRAAKMSEGLHLHQLWHHCLRHATAKSCARLMGVMQLLLGKTRRPSLTQLVEPAFLVLSCVHEVPAQCWQVLYASLMQLLVVGMSAAPQLLASLASASLQTARWHSSSMEGRLWCGVPWAHK